MNSWVYACASSHGDNKWKRLKAACVCCNCAANRGLSLAAQPRSLNIKPGSTFRSSELKLLENDLQNLKIFLGIILQATSVTPLQRGVE